MAEPLTTLATFAAIIGLGFLGYLLFERTRVTDVLILIGFGVLVGPVLGIFSVSAFQEATTLVGTLALVIIMFDGGLGIQLRDLLSGIARSTILAVVGFILTVVGVAAVAHYALDMTWLTAALFGTIVGGASGVIVMPIIGRTSASPGTRVLLSVESALTDVLCVIGAVTIISVVATTGEIGSGQLTAVGRSVMAQFAVAAVMGLLAGFVWLKLLKQLQKGKYSYMVTLAAVLGLFAGTEVMGGNGAIAVLVYGIVLGNGFHILRKLQMDGLEFSDQQRQFQGEITFLVRVFFFVYLGVILDPAVLKDPSLLLGGAMILGAILVARVLAVGIATARDPDTAQDRGLITFLFPRGLAAAVLAGLPLQAGIVGTESFLAYAFIVIVASNVLGTLAVVGYEFAKRGRTTLTPAAVGAQSGGAAGNPAREAPSPPASASSPKSPTPPS